MVKRHTALFISIKINRKQYRMCLKFIYVKTIHLCFRDDENDLVTETGSEEK